MSNEIETRESKIATLKEKAKKEAEGWFQGLLAEAKAFEKEGKTKRTIRGHLLRDYSGDIWNVVNEACNFLEADLDIQDELLVARKVETREEFIERKRLTFIYRLETVNREEIAPYIPEKVGERLKKLAEYVRQNEWNELKDMERLIEKKERIRNFVSKFF